MFRFVLECKEMVETPSFALSSHKVYLNKQKMQCFVHFIHISFHLVFKSVIERYSPWEGVHRFLRTADLSRMEKWE